MDFRDIQIVQPWMSRKMLSKKFHTVFCKLKGSSTEEIKDFVSIEEPLEMNLKYKVD